MPIYEYRCASCGHELEALQKLADAPLTVCPACGKAELRKLVSAAGFQLKGSGWYVTDFRNNGAKPAAKKPDGDTSAGVGATGRSDTKPAEGTKSEAKPAATTSTETKSAATSSSTSKSDS